MLAYHVGDSALHPRALHGANRPEDAALDAGGALPDVRQHRVRHLVFCVEISAPFGRIEARERDRIETHFAKIPSECLRVEIEEVAFGVEVRPSLAENAGVEP